jgi:Uri superfamily endonuclease
MPTAATEYAQSLGKIPNETPQTYQLLIEIPAPVRVLIGRFATFDFPAGIYCYTGSARRNFEARVSRHLASSLLLAKKPHWHIDYLLAAPDVRILTVLRHTLPECQLNQSTVGEVLLRGFGASDCHAGCGSHLKRI